MKTPSIVKISSPMALLKPAIKKYVARLGAKPIGTLFSTGVNANWIGMSGKSFLKSPNLKKMTKHIKKI